MDTSERDEFLSHNIIVEEKVDGANLGISFDVEGNIRAQNRGAYLALPMSGQWKKLEQWLLPKTDVLFEHLTDQHILFGEWCYAKHSVFYDRLPDWFLGFDIYDKGSGRFWSTRRRDELLEKMMLSSIPKIAEGYFTLTALQNLFTTSKVGSQPAEGLYFRFDRGDWMEQRAKLVRPAFIQAIENHWSHSGIISNHVITTASP